MRDAPDLDPLWEGWQAGRQAGSLTVFQLKRPKSGSGRESTFLHRTISEVQEHGHHLLSESLQNKGLSSIWVALDTGNEDRGSLHHHHPVPDTLSGVRVYSDASGWGGVHSGLRASEASLQAPGPREE